MRSTEPSPRTAPRHGARAALPACLAGLALLAGCGGGQPESAAAAGAPPWFEECALERGLDFRHVSGHREGEHLFPEIMGGGAALYDLDGDGDLDAYLVQSGSLHPDASLPRATNRMFRNDGSGGFEDATEGSGAGDEGYGMGVAVGDGDGDGDPDLYVTNVGPNRLLANDGRARFEDATERAAVGDPSWSVSAAFFDAEDDGDLDLFVANYVLWSRADELRCMGRAGHRPDYCSPKSYAAPAPDTFYRNDGAGVFRDDSAEAGFRTAYGNGLGVLCSDFDGDGGTDVFVANDGTLNQLWHNRGDGTFEDRGVRAGVATDEHGVAKAGMGVAAADLDDDGDEDLLVVNLSMESDSLYRNEGAYFSDRSALAGLALASRRFTRFGTAFADFDSDGWLDLFQANGRVARGADEGADPYAEPNLVWRGLPGARFEPLVPPDGLRAPLLATSRGAAFGDVDGDGALDVLVVNRDGPAHLLRNVAPARGGWVELRLRDARGHDALGATLSGRLGARRVRRVARSAFSYASASSPALHVGLGDAPALADVLVLWPGGAREAFDDVPAGERRTLVQGSGRAR